MVNVNSRSRECPLMHYEGHPLPVGFPRYGPAVPVGLSRLGFSGTIANSTRGPPTVQTIRWGDSRVIAPASGMIRAGRSPNASRVWYGDKDANA